MTVVGWRMVSAGGELGADESLPSGCVRLPDRENIPGTHWANLVRVKQQDRLRQARCGHELDVERVLAIGLDDSTDIPTLQSMRWDIFIEHHCVESLDVQCSVLRVRRHESWRVFATQYNPDSHDFSGPAVGPMKDAAHEVLDAIF